MIGIFDSGIGGLSVLAKIREKAPNADIIYFGDTANAPYGTRPLSELKVLTESAVEFLLSQGARDIVSACNSVSAFMTLSESGFLAQVPLSIIEMTRPTIRALARDFTGEKSYFSPLQRRSPPVFMRADAPNRESMLRILQSQNLQVQ